MASLKQWGTALVILAGFASVSMAQENTAAETDESVPPAVSQVRIVRLSQVQGEVRMDRGLNQGFEATFANLPVIQGAKLATQHGLAEVEFEDNSSVRLGPESEVEFTQLGRTASGSTVNRVKLNKGTLYVSLTKDQQNAFDVMVGDRTLSVPAGTHLRLDSYPAGSELVVFKGRVQVQDGSSTLAVGSDKALKFGGPDDAAPKLVRDEVPGLYDPWDKTSMDYHTARVAKAYAGSPYAFGSQDLNQYGSFVDAGCGSMWQPYFTSAAWNPFASGIWTYYQGAGYSWVSPYPWGWTPYHSGSWISCGNSGWGWVPSQRWAGLQNPTLFRRVSGLRPPHPGGPKPASMVLVGANEIRASHIDADHKLQFVKDSAGLGLPRDISLKLSKVSSQVSQRGSAERYVPTLTPINAHTIATMTAANQPGAFGHTGPAPGAVMSRPVATGSMQRGAGGSFGSTASSFSSSSAHASSSPSGSAATGASASSSAAAPSGGGSHH